jgi:hypothetical protein
MAKKIQVVCSSKIARRLRRNKALRSIYSIIEVK